MNYLEDPLNSDDFDPVQYINQRFPTESSLDDLDGFIAGIGAQIATLDDEISKSVQLQSVVGKQASKDILEAQQSIEELFEKIHDIKAKASQSESMVQEICADIKKLDYAKNHLQVSITALNRLQMLINAVGQLEIIAHDYQYREVANLLDAVKQFMTHFDKYTHISMIADIQKRIDKIGADLTRHVRKNFRDLAKMVESVADADVMLADVPGGVRAVADSCLVVDSLGGSVRRELLEEFVQLQLVPYENLFGPSSKEQFTLEQVDRRWFWFKRLLKHIDAKFGQIFPAHWRLPLRLCLEFMERTKIHLVTMLTDLESRDQIDVSALLKALQQTLRFEQEMTDRFNLLKELKQSQEAEAASPKTAVDRDAKLRLKRDDKLMYIPVDHTAENKVDETESGFLSLAHACISGGVSGVFDKFLGSYVLLERQNLEDLLRKLSQQEDVASEGEGGAVSTHGNVYNSATDMFVFIKNSIKRCTALTTGQTFLSLSKEFKTCMQQYAELLRNRCPPPSSSGPGQPPVYRLPVSGEVAICYLINTGEYCAEVVPQLEQMVQQKMLPSLAAKVDFATETDAFFDLVAFSLKVLVSGLMDRLDPSFRTMAGINWGATSSVGEESSYLHVLNAVLLDAIPRIRESLSPSYFNNYCTKLATEILGRFLDAILRQKRISDMATQQLLLDTYNVKTLLLQLQQLTADANNRGSSTGPAPSSMYVKFVTGKVAHIEMVLKLVGTPEDMLLERFRIMWPEGTAADLQLLMALKGVKRPDQTALLEMFGLSASGSSKSAAVKNIGSLFSGPSSSSTSSSPAPSGTSAAPVSGYSTASAAASASAAAMASSMKSLTHDLSSTTRNALGNLKWTTGTK